MWIEMEGGKKGESGDGILRLVSGEIEERKE